MQKRAVDNILSGEYPTKKAALEAAGYKESAASTPKATLAKAEGVQIYLKQLDLDAKERWGKSIGHKVMDVYADGLDATKLYGKDSVEHPDFGERRQYADRLSELMGWRKPQAEAGSRPIQYQQFNYFSVNEERREEFNKNFKKFLKDFYA